MSMAGSSPHPTTTNGGSHVRAEQEQVIDALAYDVPVAGRMIGVGTTKVWELVRGGDLPTIRIGRRRLVTKDALLAFLDRLSASAA